MKKPLPCLGALLVFLVTGLCAEDGHHQVDSNQKLGTVSFPTSCSPTVQKAFERGVALLHSFWFDEAYKQFQSVAAQDPHCAIAYWARR